MVDQNKVEDLIAQRQKNAEARQLMRAAAHLEAQRAEQPLRHVDSDFEHDALVATARNDSGMRRSGVYVGPEKTLIPENTFKSEAAYNAFVNERGLVVNPAPTSKAELEQLKSVGEGEGGDAETKPLEEHTVPQLREMAGEIGIEGASSMNKAPLIAAIRKAQAE